MPTYKLTYFNLNALVEPIRWAFKVAGVDFEDERIEMHQWAELKESGRFPGKQMPLLEIDGIVYTQATAILRYLAKKFDLVADDDFLNFRIDQASDIVTDGRISYRRILLEKDDVKKAEVKKDLLTNVFPTILKQLADIVSTTEGDFITGSKLTWGDLVLANWLLIWESLDDSLLNNYPALLQQKNAVLAIPAINNWIQVRPKVWL